MIIITFLFIRRELTFVTDGERTLCGLTPHHHPRNTTMLCNAVFRCEGYGKGDIVLVLRG